MDTNASKPAEITAKQSKGKGKTKDAAKDKAKPINAPLAAALAKADTIDAKHYLANGGTKQVLARACVIASNSNLTIASIALALACGGVRKATKEGQIKDASNQMRTYVAWAAKDERKRLEEHKTWQDAQALASALVKAC